MLEHIQLALSFGSQENQETELATQYNLAVSPISVGTTIPAEWGAVLSMEFRSNSRGVSVQRKPTAHGPRETGPAIEPVASAVL